MTSFISFDSSGMTSEVFRPSKGPLLVRGPFAEAAVPSGHLHRAGSRSEPTGTWREGPGGTWRTGPTQRPDLSLPEYSGTSGQRPPTQGGYRFGRLSYNSFFSRHSPHPNRVKHFKGKNTRFKSTSVSLFFHVCKARPKSRPSIANCGS